MEVTKEMHTGRRKNRKRAVELIRDVLRPLFGTSERKCWVKVQLFSEAITQLAMARF